MHKSEGGHSVSQAFRVHALASQSRLDAGLLSGGALQVQFYGLKAVESFQDQCISELLNYLQADCADCLLRRDAVSNNAEMHGPENFIGADRSILTNRIESEFKVRDAAYAIHCQCDCFRPNGREFVTFL